MHVYLTTCTAEKSHESGVIPAARRYQGHRIDVAVRWAAHAGHPLVFFSGVYGWLRDVDPIPYYDHALLPDEVAEVAARFAKSLSTNGITRVTALLEAADRPGWAPYHTALLRGTERAGVAFDWVDYRALSAPIVRIVNPDDQRIPEVARRMRRTLQTVLGVDAGTALYSLESLEDRVRFHLDPTQSTGAVWIVEAPSSGMFLGHTIVRREASDGAAFGLFSTTWVEPHARHLGLAQRLLDCGEAWMVAQGLSHAVTDTASHNEPLIKLFERRGYSIVARSDDGQMVRLRGPLHSAH